MTKRIAHIWLLAMAMAAVIPLSSCSSDNDEPAQVEDTNGLEGVWVKYDSSDPAFIKFGSNNRYEDYTFSTRNDLSYTYWQTVGKYTYDPATDLIIIHYSGNEDCDIYYAKLSGARLMLNWIDDVSHLYSSSTFSVEQDMRVIQRYDQSGYDLWPADQEVYTRSNEKTLNAEIAKIN